MDLSPAPNPAQSVATTTVDQASLDYFTQIPWMNEVLKSKSFVIRPLSWRTQPSPTAAETFMSRTLNSTDTIPHFCNLVSREGQSNGPEMTALLQLGADVAGIPGIAHGGVLSAILDEIMGTLVVIQDESSDFMTANLTVDFRRPVSIPGPILVEARLEGKEGRKVRVVADVMGVPYGAEDGTAVVCTTGRALFIKLRSQAEQSK